MGAAKDQIVFLAFLPFVDQVDVVVECIAVDFGVIVNTIIQDGKPTIDMVVVVKLVVEIAQV